MSSALNPFEQNRLCILMQARRAFFRAPKKNYDELWFIMDEVRPLISKVQENREVATFREIRTASDYFRDPGW